jgi:hypothetical protein
MVRERNDLAKTRVESMAKKHFLSKIPNLSESKKNAIARRMGMILLYEIAPPKFLGKYIRKKHPDLKNATLETSQKFKELFSSYDAIFRGRVDNEILCAEMWKFYKHIKRLKYQRELYQRHKKEEKKLAKQKNK